MASEYQKAQSHKNVLLSWSLTAVQHGLTPVETVVLAAEFCGLAVPKCNLTLEGQSEIIEIAGRIIATSCVGNNAVRQGFGRPVPAGGGKSHDNTEGSGS